MSRRLVLGALDAGTTTGGGPAAHWLFNPQCSFAGQLPQLTEAPGQLPSGINPHVAFWALQVVCVHATHCSISVQVSPEPHEPQARVPPQPSAIVPQCAPSAAQVVGWQHWFDEVHSSPLEQEPQFSVPPQPSPVVPQCAPSAAQVVGVQQRLPTQVSPPGHEPQLSC
jgi:hypothetical protein